MGLSPKVTHLWCKSLYDPRRHSIDAVALLDSSDLKEVFSRGWCYSLAAHCQQVGIGDATLLAKTLGGSLEVCHAAVVLPNGMWLDVSGIHQDLEVLSDAGDWGQVLVSSPGRVSFYADSLMEERSFWTGLPEGLLAERVSKKVTELFEVWREEPLPFLK